MPGESGQLGINEDLFFAGSDEIENSGVVDLTRNTVKKGRESSDQGSDDLDNIIQNEKSISDAAYRAGKYEL